MGSTTAIAVAKALTDIRVYEGVKIIGIDTHKEKDIAGSAFCSKFYRSLPHDDPNYINQLLDICRLEDVSVVFPIHDLELLVVSKAKDRFEGISVWVSDPRTIEICNDKLKFYKRMNPTLVPYTRCLDSPIPDDMYPAIVKPRQGVSSRGVYKVNKHEDIYTFGHDYIIQKYVHGHEYTVDVVCDKNSIPLTSVPRMRIMTKAGISITGRTVKQCRISDLAEDICKELGIIGAANVQIIESDAGLHLIEVNPRFSGGLALTTRAGVNIPKILYILSKEENVTNDDLNYKAGVIMRRFWAELWDES